LPELGILSTPAVDENRAYYVSNRGELMCVRLDGGRRANVVWELDMVKTLGVFKRDASDIGNPLPSPVVWRDLVYCVTGNGSAFGFPERVIPGGLVPRPGAPSFIAVEKLSGKVVWSKGLGNEIIYGQWSSPAIVADDNGCQVVFPGGDGWLYGCDGRTGQVRWKVDYNSASATRWKRDRRGSRNFYAARPTVRGDTVYIAPNQEWEAGARVPGSVYAIAIAPRRERGGAAVRWHYQAPEFEGAFGSVAIGRDAVYVLGRAGSVLSLDALSGRRLWHRQLGVSAGRFTSPVIDQGKLWVGTAEYLFVLEAESGRQLARYDLGSEIMGTPVLVDRVVYVASRDYLWAIRADVEK
jgi:outer membrane protein assembly factor BamB